MAGGIVSPSGRLVIFLARSRTLPRSHAAKRYATCRRTRPPNPCRWYAMMPTNVSTEEAVIEMLQRTGPCCLENLALQLPNCSWGEVFAAVNRLSREDRLVIRRQWLVRRLGNAFFQITLHSQLASPPPVTISPGGRASRAPLAARF
jgi:hypothetical protein